jgi:hypothetical protein
VNRLKVSEKEWLIHADIDELLKLNYRTQVEARRYVRRLHLEIRNNVESIDSEDLDMRKRYGEQEESKKREGET